MDFRIALLESITNNFSEEQKIGSGGYADIYRAVHNGEEIAVKQLHQLKGLDDKQFHNEIRSLTKISHKNVIRLIGYCYESRSKYIEHNGERVFAKIQERVLCFEYMQGGSLDKYIIDEPCRLDWPTCYKIIQGTCEGLNHLHNAQEKAIFHLDLKPSHILLNKNMNPKITGLNLSRPVDSTEETHQIEMRDLEGTYGYVPPEYFDMGIISNKFDVYSLGCIILRMMDGNRFVSRYFGMSTNQFIENVSEQWKERLQTMSERSSYEVDILQVRTCVEIALRCIEKDRNKRPSIEEIICELGIKTVMSPPPDHKSNWFGLDSQSHSTTTPDQPKDLTEAEIKRNLTEAEIKTNLPEPEIKKILSVPPDQSGLDSQLCSTIGPDYSKDQIEDETETIMSLHPDHKSTRSGLDSQSRSVTDRSKDQILQEKYISMDREIVVPTSIAFHLLETITDGFSEQRQLGSGAYGKVYMGVHENGNKIAVKKLYSMPGLDDAQFEKEYHNLAILRHNNIVQLVGYCHETRREYVPYNGKIVLAEETQRALCFEFMKNGSLESCLSDEFSGHDWRTRYSIIKGTCHGLKYLHVELTPPMFHLDLKPANVLLDENMVPKIADFGLSRLFGEKRTQITYSLLGTLGYLPPEYINWNVISNKFDIFSLGVIIIKLMTGPMGYSKYAEMISSEKNNAEMSSQKFIELVQGNWRDRLHSSSVHVPESCYQVKTCIEIALSCVETDRHKRPNIGDIIDKINEREKACHSG